MIFFASTIIQSIWIFKHQKNKQKSPKDIWNNFFFFWIELHLKRKHCPSKKWWRKPMIMMMLEFWLLWNNNKQTTKYEMFNSRKNSMFNVQFRFWPLNYFSDFFEEFFTCIVHVQASKQVKSLKFKDFDNDNDKKKDLNN